VPPIERHRHEFAGPHRVAAHAGGRDQHAAVGSGTDIAAAADDEAARSEFPVQVGDGVGQARRRRALAGQARPPVKALKVISV
jgi:hypothetical protein